MNHTFLQYTHDVDEETGWGNSLYRQHNFEPLKRLSYGIFMGGRLDKGTQNLIPMDHLLVIANQFSAIGYLFNRKSVFITIKTKTVTTSLIPLYV
ncbi:Uncharacterised protein [Actinobacillus equuli]|nr:Uncharacterised protein [Actinobacillus equuli]